MSLAALRWSPASTPRPPEYWGRAAATPKRAEQAIAKTLERVRYFKQKMLRPERLDGSEAKLASFGVKNCAYCGEPVQGSACGKCGAAPTPAG